MNQKYEQQHFGSHLGGHLGFFKTLHDVRLASYRLFNGNMSSNRISNSKNYTRQGRVIFTFDQTIPLAFKSDIHFSDETHKLYDSKGEVYKMILN